MLWKGLNNMKSFINNSALLTVMIQAPNPDIVIERINSSLIKGAEAYGLQLEVLDKEYRNVKTYNKIFDAMGDKPVYITNYRKGSNEGKTDDELAKELLEIVDCGATLIDVMGDYFHIDENELTMDEEAVNKQIKLIEELHKKGAEVIMSSHVYKFLPLEKVLEIAYEQQRRGADIVKIVTGALTMEEQIENLRITTVLKEKLEKPFLFLSFDNSFIHRRLGIMLGCCMGLCVDVHDEWSTPAQPLLEDFKKIRDLGFK